MKRGEIVFLAEAFRDARAEIVNKEPAESQADLLDGVSYAAEFVAGAIQRNWTGFDLLRFLRDAGVQS